MRQTKVGAVMITEVTAIAPDTGFKDIARTLDAHRVSGAPVLDGERRLLGVVSESDLMHHQADCAEQPHGRLRRLRRLLRAWLPSARRARAKTHALTARELLTAPAVTVAEEATIAEAARIMVEHRVNRLPVVDGEGRLTGIVTRRELLNAFLRPDDAIRRSVVDDVVGKSLWLDPHAVGVSVADGVVTLSGTLERYSEKAMTVHMTGLVDGVVAVVDELAYTFDDRDLPPVPHDAQGIAGDRLHRP
ncbi:CBS domain-containing protein [Streptomyces sp. HNM0663]|uniref:CBS domain-containing protein n=1 Tax=Streptomyces chengmaiensis TaxID=3040919 RepID=A0ABT6HH69_9ACTN|nr:CBS domain-containing protein [Streptomyces chengmaiensis]MDH2387935.1 CBS domain-containing protein [Streptomyces chengmaiensis]